MREAQERKGLWLSLAAPLPVLFGEPPELDQSRLLRMQFRAELRQTFSKLLEETLGFRPAFEAHHKVSRPGESHPEPLSEPYLNLSAHTAPAMEPRRTPICQCAHNFGSRLEMRATQCVARRKCLRSFLYFRSAQRANARSSCPIGG